jgi:hypothetical protein
LSVIKRDLAKIDLPPQSQIVIAARTDLASGWYRSSGMLEYALKRPTYPG